MINGSIVATLTGVAGVLALVSLFGYFLSSKIGEDVAPFDVAGREIPASVIETLKHLKTDEAKLEWLKTHMQLSTELAKIVVEKSKQFDPNSYASKARSSRDKRFLWLCLTFVALAVVGALYEHFREKQQPSVAIADPPVPPVPPVPKKPDPVWEWTAKRPSGTTYSQEFHVETHNRHNMAQTGQSGFIRAAELTDPPGHEKRITSASYRCEGTAIGAVGARTRMALWTSTSRSAKTRKL